MSDSLVRVFRLVSPAGKRIEQSLVYSVTITVTEVRSLWQSVDVIFISLLL